MNATEGTNPLRLLQVKISNGMCVECVCLCVCQLTILADVGRIPGGEQDASGAGDVAAGFVCGI